LFSPELATLFKVKHSDIITGKRNTFAALGIHKLQPCCKLTRTGGVQPTGLRLSQLRGELELFTGHLVLHTLDVGNGPELLKSTFTATLFSGLQASTSTSEALSQCFKGVHTRTDATNSLEQCTELSALTNFLRVFNLPKGCPVCFQILGASRSSCPHLCESRSRVGLSGRTNCSNLRHDISISGSGSSGTSGGSSA
jgi:hypothetical protein